MARAKPAPAAPRPTAAAHLWGLSGTAVVAGDTTEARTIRRRLIEAGAAVGGVGDLGDADVLIDARDPYAAGDLLDAADGVAAESKRRFNDLSEHGRFRRVVRPAWIQQIGDRWLRAGSVWDAALRLQPSWRRVFWSARRADLLKAAPAFLAQPDRLHYTRLPAGGDASIPNARRLPEAEKPSVQSEAMLLRTHQINAIIARNEGGEGAYCMIAAARALRLPVIMLDRPASAARSAAFVLEGAEAALRWAFAELSMLSGARAQAALAARAPVS